MPGSLITPPEGSQTHAGAQRPASLSLPPEPAHPALPLTGLETMGTSPQVHRDRANRQRLWERRSIEQTLRTQGYAHLLADIPDCHTTQYRRQCRDCGHLETWWNHCDQHWCPICQRRQSAKRARELEAWAALISRPKHLVLTARNTKTLSADYLARLKSALSKLRRSACFRPVAGGCWSMEVTNEGRGWHVHFHLLLDAEWLDKGAVARRWASLVDQDFAIVAVKAIRSNSYVREVAKYVAKGSQLARWTGHDLAAFITAVHGCRMFGTFGTLYDQRASWKAAMEADQTPDDCPQCGAEHWEPLDPIPADDLDPLETGRAPPDTRARTAADRAFRRLPALQNPTPAQVLAAVAA